MLWEVSMMNSTLSGKTTSEGSVVQNFPESLSLLS